MDRAHLKSRVHETLRDARVGAKELPELRSKPELAKSWLKEAKSAQLTLVVVVVLGLFVWPTLRDAAVDVVFPAKTSRSLFRTRRRDHPAADTARTVLDVLYWGGGSGAAVALLLSRLPLHLGRRREDEEEGDVATAATEPPPARGAEVSTEATMLAPGASASGAPASATGAPTGSTGFGPGTASPATPGAATTSALEGPPGRYAIEAELGRGGMGVVHRARDTVLDRPVALKELPASLMRDAATAERFRTEARALARLSHPGIVQVYDLVENGEGMWIAMELVAGMPLDERMEEGPMEPAEVARLGKAMAEAMAYAHRQGVVHRDFKPHNVLLDELGNPKVTDFGLAKMAQGPTLTQAGTVMGTPAYLSPEQASGKEIGPSTDIYALGVTLYQMATGRLPFDGDTAAILMQHITQEPPDPRTVRADMPGELAELILSMLDKDPEKRPADMETVASWLHPLGERD